MRDPFWKSLKILLSYKRLLALALAGALVSAACFGGGILSLLPTLNLLLNEQASLGEVAQEYLGGDDRPHILQNLAQWIEHHAPSDRFRAFLVVMGVITVLSIIGSAGRYIHELLTISLVNRAAMIWRLRLFRRLIHAPIVQVLRTSNADHIGRLLFDVRVMTRGYLAVLGKAVAQVLKGFAALLGALILDWQLTVLALVGAPIMAILLGKFGRRIRRATKRALVHRGRMIGALNESLGGIQVVKVHNAEGYERRRFGLINKALFHEEMKMRQAKALASPVIDTLALLGVILVASVAAWSILGSRSMSPHQIMTVLAALVLAAASFKPLTSIYTQMREASAAAARVLQMLHWPVEPAGTHQRRGTAALHRHAQSVAFENTSFTYPEGNRPAVDQVNLHATFGSTVALVGANGAGKTTLVNLLPRLLLPAHGRILIDRHDIRNVSLRSLRRQIAVVTQQTVLFEGTIAQNIAYGRRHTSMANIMAAAKAAHAHSFIAALPNGYDTMLAEDGAGLSGGQMQRICIARAILRNPAILILDEATSQIDADSEAEINKALRDFRQGRTTFVIAHRLSTVIDADQIVVMDAGRIIDQGCHDELLNRCVIYRTLAQTQLRPSAA